MRLMLNFGAQIRRLGDARCSSHSLRPIASAAVGPEPGRVWQRRYAQDKWRAGSAAVVNVSTRSQVSGRMNGRFADMRILLVEDEPLIGMMARTVLEEQGANVLWVQTDRDAYRAIEAEESALRVLITDINLREGTTGFDIARFARRRFPGLPVIYVSGEERGALSSFAVEQALFLYKPVPESVLVDAVESMVSTDTPQMPPEPVRVR